MTDPNAHAIGVMALTVVALFLFSREKLAVETSALIVITVLAVGFTLFPYQTSDGGSLPPAEFFLGFGNEALIAVCALMIAGRALVRTGALTPVGRLVSRVWKLQPAIALLVVMLVLMAISGFVNNTPLVVLMIPILVTLASRTKVAASKTLIPVTFATQIGGMATPIGTGLNLLVLGSAATYGVAPFGMFDFYLPAIIAGGIGILYLWLVAPRLLPEREAMLTDASPRVFTSRLNIPEDSDSAGKKLSELIARTENQMKVVRIERADGVHVSALPDLVIKTGDKIVVTNTPDRLKEFERSLDANLYSGDAPVDAENPLTVADQQIAELVVTRASMLDGRTLNEVDFDERWKLLPIALHRAGYKVEQDRAHLHDMRLGLGDVLLVQGAPDQIDEIKRGADLLVVDATADLPRTKKAPIAALVMAGIVILAVLKILPIVSAALAGIVALIATRTLRWQDIVGALDAPLIFLTAASIALSLALVETKAADFIAQSFIGLSAGLDAAFVLSGLILLMAVMANVISNSAAAVIGTPIGISIANGLGAPPEPFVLAVLFGVNMGYATPIADNCNLLVYSAGGYTFNDFPRVGIPLVLIMWLSYSILLPRFFPLS